MNDFKHKFISSKFYFGLCMVGIILFSAVLIGNTVYSIWRGVPILLIGNLIAIVCLVLCFVLLRKEVFIVKVHDDKIAFKAIGQKEKVLYLSEIKNIYEYT